MKPILTMTREDVEKVGQWLTNGALERLMQLALIFTLTWVVCSGVSNALAPLDDSDAPGVRSGFVVRRDALTGCEYLDTRNAVTPRLRADGRQVCRR